MMSRSVVFSVCAATICASLLLAFVSNTRPTLLAALSPCNPSACVCSTQNRPTQTWLQSWASLLLLL